MLPREWNIQLIDMNVARLKDSHLHWANYGMISGMLVHRESVHQRLHLEPGDARLRASLFRVARVLREEVTEAGGWDLELELPRREYDRLRKNDPDFARACGA
jgi:hypothetical protein